MSPKDETSALLSETAGGGHSIVVDLERKRRRRLVFTLTVGCCFLILVGFIAVWISHERPQRTYVRVASDAADNLLLLNSDVKAMSKVMAPGCETTVLIMRHCEKVGPDVVDEDKNEHCSYIGFERAKFVATLFGNGNERWPMPHDLFALSPVRNSHWTFRQWETLHPLATKVGAEVNVIGMDELGSEIFELLQSGSLCGQVIVVAWKHELIPSLAVALGCGPNNGCPTIYPEDSYDQVWQLKYVFNGAIEEPTVAKIKDTEPETPTEQHKGDTMEDVPVDETNESQPAHRVLRRFRQSSRGWSVYGTVANLEFDPLSFSKSVGDYPLGGTASGGRWDEEM